MSEAGPAANTTTAGATSEASARLSAVPRVTGSRIIWVDGCEASGPPALAMTGSLFIMLTILAETVASN